MKEEDQTPRIIAIIAIGVLLVLMSTCSSGCSAVPAAAPSRLLPWNWFHSDANARVDKAVKRADGADLAAVHAAAIESRKAAEVLATVEKTREIELASRFLGNANGLLAQVTPITAAEDASLRKIVAGFLSFKPDLVTEAESRQVVVEKGIAKVSIEIAKAEAAEKIAIEKLGAANVDNAIQASKYRRLWFWIWTAVAIYVLIQVLPVISKLFPALAPIAKAASWVAAPAVQAGYSRLRGAVGEALHAAHKAGSVTIETLRQRIDTPIDVAEQKELEKQFKAAAAANASST